MTTDDPRSLAESLAVVTRGLGLTRPTDVMALCAHWPELVGDALANHTRPAHIREGTLTINVDAGTWGAPLKYLGDTLMARANELLGTPRITAIRIVVRPDSTDPTPPGSPPPIRPVPEG